LSAAAIDEAVVLDLFADQIEVRHQAAFDPATASVTPIRSRFLGAIRLSTGPDPQPDQAAIEAALLDGVREHGLQQLAWTERGDELRRRAAFAAAIDASVSALDDETLLRRAEEWLAPLLTGRRRLSDIPGNALADGLEQILGYEGKRVLDRLAPSQFESPEGSRFAIAYDPVAGPTVEVRAQALFGLCDHPMVGGGRVPLVLAITSPAGRLIQRTTDLPDFWRGSWRDVAKDMRGRYPKHHWPDDPATARPTLRSKRFS
jgi:ATP-dependent helicase HrpB